MGTKFGMLRARSIRRRTQSARWNAVDTRAATAAICDFDPERVARPEAAQQLEAPPSSTTPQPAPSTSAADTAVTEANRLMEEEANKVKADEDIEETEADNKENVEPEHAQRKSIPANLPEDSLQPARGATTKTIRLRLFQTQMSNTVGCRACMAPGPVIAHNPACKYAQELWGRVGPTDAIALLDKTAKAPAAEKREQADVQKSNDDITSLDHARLKLTFDSAMDVKDTECGGSSSTSLLPVAVPAPSTALEEIEVSSILRCCCGAARIAPDKYKNSIKLEAEQQHS